MPRATVLVIEADELLRTVMIEHLSAGGYRVLSWERESSARRDGLEEPGPDVVVADLRSCGSPAAFLNRWQVPRPVIFLADNKHHAESIPELVDLLRRGAADYLTKPINGVTLLRAVYRALRMRVLEGKVTRLASQVAGLAGDSRVLVGESREMAAVRESINRVASMACPVLLLGETGVGKELVAREIHRLSGRSGEFVAINTASFSESLFEAEIFGYEPGSFTGATGRKMGLAEIADGGSLFLDEIGEMPSGLQAKLLRFLDDGRFRRVGGLREVETEVRVVAATHRDIEADLRAETPGFRSDLFYRLSAYIIRIPPLRERIEDLPALWDCFSRSVAERENILVPPLADSAWELLRRHEWPGNVREFRHFVSRIAILCPGQQVLRDEDVVMLLGSPTTASSGVTLPQVPAGVNEYQAAREQFLDDFDRQFLRRFLQSHRFNISAAARELNWDRKTLATRLKKLGLLTE